MKKYLTKSLFTHALDCPTKLYYKSNSKDYVSSQDDDDFLRALAEGGMQVGELAKCYFEDVVEIEYSTDKKKSIQESNKLLKKENIVIYEAAIHFENTYALVDVLEKKGNRINLIEVKSKSWDEEVGFYGKRGGIMPGWHKYLHDIAFQTWVAQRAFPNHEIHPYLMLIDKNKASTVDGLHQYFKVVQDEKGRSSIKLRVPHEQVNTGEPILTQISVIDEVNLIFDGNCRTPQSDLEAQGFDAWVRGLAKLLNKNEKYPVLIGDKCNHCEYRVATSKLMGKRSGFEECWKKALNWTGPDFQKPHAFDVWFSNAKKLMADHVHHMDEITPDYIGTEESGLYDHSIWDDGRKQRQLAQVMKMTGRHEDSEVVLSGLYEEMDTWKYPLHFIDFEGVAPAIPFYKGLYPYKKIPFQFSIHDVGEDGSVEHVAEWVEITRGKFPCFDFVRELKKALGGDDGSVFMYHHYERTTLRDVRAMLLDSSEPDRDELVEFIDTLVEDGSPRAMIDQQKLVIKYYYSVHMRGSNSIKDVLPAVLAESKFLKDNYSKPYSGLSIKNQKLYQVEDGGEVTNPYKLLPPIEIDDIPNPIEIEDMGISKNEAISEGGTAMMAWARMQFDDVTDEEREATFQALLRYCELDTLAMVMIHQHWQSVRHEGSQ
jgi:hypothetical protein